MSEYLVQRQSLENIADEIRVLSGTTEPLGLGEMATNVSDANDELAAQATQIEEIMELLEGKSVPGGSGGNVKIYPAGEVSKGTKLGDNTLTYACPLDELDFFTMSMDKLTLLASAVFEAIPETVNLIEFYNLLGYRVMLQADESYEGYYNADAIVLYMEMEEGVFYPMDAIMVKITPEIIAAEGLSIEPGIYLVHSQKIGVTMSVIYTGP